MSRFNCNVYWSITTANLHEFHNNLEYFPKIALRLAEFFYARKLTNLEDGVNKVTPQYG